MAEERAKRWLAAILAANAVKNTATIGAAVGGRAADCHLGRVSNCTCFFGTEEGA